MTENSASSRTTSTTDPAPRTATDAQRAAFINEAYQTLVWQRAFYEDLHRHPELSLHEERTAARIIERLRCYDAEVIAGIGGHGVVAILRNGDGPTALFRADMDALPVHETSGAAYASTARAIDDQGLPVPVMHACGHDMHMTALMGATEILDRHRDRWSGTFIALFQPSEENGSGADNMVRDGLVEKLPRPDVCFGQHIMPGPAGQVQSRPGAQLAACDSIRIRIPGRSAHGSMPHESIDPTFTAAMIVVRLQGIVGREVAPEEFAVVSVGTLRAGETNNIIPGHAELVLNCRFYDDAVKERVYAAIRRVVIAECQASGVTEQPTFEFFSHGPLVDNDPQVYARVRALLDATLGDDSVTSRPSTVSEDFPNLPDAWGSPYLFWLVGCTPRAQWEAAHRAPQAGGAGATGAIQSVPVNHMGTFLPDYAPTVAAATKAATAAVLAYLS